MEQLMAELLAQVEELRTTPIGPDFVSEEMLENNQRFEFLLAQTDKLQALLKQAYLETKSKF